MGDYVLTVENLITGSLADDDDAMGGYPSGSTGRGKWERWEDHALRRERRVSDG